MCSVTRRLLGRIGEWIRVRPRLASWAFPPPATEASLNYRTVNRRCFASFYEQERMLADGPRMEFYHRAIERHVHPGDRVIDLGTGTGILAGFAARRGAASVHAIDHSGILEYAKTVAAHNGVEHVTFVAKHSSEFTLDEPVDVILHEQMGDCLFDEAMVANVTELRDRLLKPGGRILPSRFELYCEPVKLRDDRVVPFLWELNVHGYDYGCMEKHRPEDQAYYHRSSSDQTLVECFLGESEPILKLDLQTVRPTDLPPEISFTRTVAHAGRLDGLVVFFKARVDEDLCLSTSPLEEGRAPHWGFRLLRLDREPVKAGDRLDIQLRVERWENTESWRWKCVRRPAGQAAERAGVDQPTVAR